MGPASTNRDEHTRLAITGLPARDLAAAIRSGRTTATQAVDASLATIERDDATLHAFVTIDREGAQQTARALDDAMARDGPVGPLHGVPVAIKDLTPTRALRTTRGSLRHRDDVPLDDDLIVARLRDAGAVIIGKTNTPEFGFGALCRNPIAGNTANPYATGHSSGGSSGGSAAAVAAGMVPLAHGTDFGGSVRTPASFCGIVGLRPGAGAVPSVGKTLAWNALAVHGALARDVRDADLMFRVLSGGDDRDPVSMHAGSSPEPDWDDPSLGRVRLASAVGLGVAIIAKDVAAVFDRAVQDVASQFSVEPACPDFSGAPDAFATLRAAIIHREFGALLTDDGPALAPTVRWNIEQGRTISADAFLRAETVRSAVYQRCLDFFETYDFLLTAAASVPPFPLSQEDVLAIDGRPLATPIEYLTITSVISLVGLPAITVPCGFTAEGLPIGLQVVGRPRSERRLLALANRFETDLGFKYRRPAGLSE